MIDIAHFTVVPVVDTIDGPVVPPVVELALAEVVIEPRLRAILGGEGSRRIVRLVGIEIVDPQEKRLFVAGLEPLETAAFVASARRCVRSGWSKTSKPADRPEYLFSGVALTKAAVR